MRYRSLNCKFEGNHHGHLPVLSAHVSQRIKHLPNNVDDFITGSIKEGLGSGVICNLVLNQFKRTLTEVDVCHYRDKLSFNLLKQASVLPYGTPVEMLIAEFHLKKDLCIILWIQML